MLNCWLNGKTVSHIIYAKCLMLLKPQSLQLLLRMQILILLIVVHFVPFNIHEPFTMCVDISQCTMYNTVSMSSSR